MIIITLKENAWQAKLAATKLGYKSAAIVFGKTIYLCNVSKFSFLNNKTWLRHEVAHVKQYEQIGFVKFLLLYLVESIKHGYERNRFEVEARALEKDDQILVGVDFV